MGPNRFTIEIFENEISGSQPQISDPSNPSFEKRIREWVGGDAEIVGGDLDLGCLRFYLTGFPDPALS